MVTEENDLRRKIGRFLLGCRGRWKLSGESELGYKYDQFFLLGVEVNRLAEILERVWCHLCMSSSGKIINKLEAGRKRDEKTHLFFTCSSRAEFCFIALSQPFFSGICGTSCWPIFSFPSEGSCSLHSVILPLSSLQSPIGGYIFPLKRKKNHRQQRKYYEQEEKQFYFSC